MTDKNETGNGSENPEELNFAVMPQDAGGDLISSDKPLEIAPTPPSRPAANAELPAEPTYDSENGGRGKGFYLFISALILAALGILAYYLLWPTPQDSAIDSENSKLPKVFLMQHFNTESCTDSDACGDNADPDQDGLNNYDEFVEQTDPKLNDTDGDGLADGDEVKVYLTNPIKKFTDPRREAELAGYHDGSQIRNSYDPLTPGLRMTEVRINQIKANQDTYGLHEPTITTLDASTPQAQTIQINISNNKFDPDNRTVKVGDTVIWINKDVSNHQIASDPHPTHTGLPDLESGLLATNQTYSFKFTEAGTFPYHDHINPAIKGTITVQ